MGGLSLGYSERKKLKEMLLESEANIPWMYCDSRGNVTVELVILFLMLRPQQNYHFKLKRNCGNPKADPDEYNKILELGKKYKTHCKLV